MDRLWALVAAILPALAALLVPMPAVDLAYQLRAGGEILGGDGIPAVDTWTFTVAGTPWLDQQWGAQVVLGAIFGLTGWSGLAVLRAVLLAVTFALLFGAIRRAGGGAVRPAPAAVLTLVAFGVAAPALALRPQLFGILLFAATLFVLADRVARPGRLWLLPVFAAAWANLHGSFPILLVVAGLACLDDVLWGRWSEAGRLVLVSLVAAGATLLNPFTIDVWGYVANLASNPTIAGQVSEWRPPSPLEPTGAVFFASVAVTAALGAAVLVAGLRGVPSGRRAVTAARFAAPVLALVAFAALGTLTGRGLAWWALAAPVALAGLVAATGGGRRRGPAAPDAAASVVAPTWVPEALRPLPREARPSRLNSILAVAFISAFVALLPMWRPTGPAGVPERVLSHAPEALAVELQELVDGGVVRRGARVWNPQLWGSWLEHAVPELTVALDSRLELFPASVWAEAEVIASGAGLWHALLVRHQVFVVVVAPEQVALRQALERASGWTSAYRGPDGQIWLRAFGQRYPIG